MMKEAPQRVFTLEEANELIPELASFTGEVLRELDAIRQRYAIDGSRKDVSVPENVLQEVEDLLKSWTKRVMDLGAAPKGYFTADFPTQDPEQLYCWTYGEERITHTHKVWENFSHRRPIGSGVDGPSDHLKWVN
jgi:hypothetical protein